jgi:hypothetical protein
MNSRLKVPLLHSARHEGSAPLFHCMTEVVSRKANNMAFGILNMVSNSS